MIQLQWSRVRQEWRQNRRLRLGLLVVVAILGVHALLTLSDRQKAAVEQFERDAELLLRLQSAAGEVAWPQRAKQAEAAVADLRQSLPSAKTQGGAQADLQAWLAKLAVDSALEGAQVRVEATVDVPGHPQLWQVLARLDASAPSPLGLAPFVRGLSEGLPWIQVEQLQIGEGQPAQVVVIVRAYYRKRQNEAPPRGDGGVVPQQAAPASPPDVAVPGGVL